MFPSMLKHCMWYHCWQQSHCRHSCPHLAALGVFWLVCWFWVKGNITSQHKKHNSTNTRVIFKLYFSSVWLRVWVIIIQVQKSIAWNWLTGVWRLRLSEKITGADQCSTKCSEGIKGWWLTLLILNMTKISEAMPGLSSGLWSYPWCVKVPIQYEDKTKTKMTQ